MTTHTNQPKSAAPSYPDASSVGPHVVIDRAEWRSGRGPDPRGDDDRASYYCLSCGAERVARREFPDTCDGPPPDDRSGSEH